MKNEYIQPIIEFDTIDTDYDLLAGSQPHTQCHCYSHEIWGGCVGCNPRTCNCNHWDGEKIVPGCHEEN